MSLDILPEKCCVSGVEVELWLTRTALGSTNLIIESDKVTINGAENLTVYEDKNSLSGNSVYRSFCKTCGW